VVEGQVLVNNVNTAANEYVTVTQVPVTVGDGRLTVTVGGTAGVTTLNYIVISTP